MEKLDLYDLKETVNSHGILISFAGPFSHGIIEELGQAVTRYLEAQALAKASLMDVFSVFIEQTQNVRNYAAKREAEGNRALDFNNGIVTIGRKGAHHVVCSGNFLKRCDVEPLTARLEQLRNLDRKELKILFKQQLHRERQVDQGGGLGLIDMSRKSAQPLEYEVRTLDPDYCFFSLRATL
jgi:hypothetical protein